MLGLLGVLLLMWVACIVVGGLVKGLVWLLVVGAVLLVATGVLGFLKRETLGRGRDRGHLER